MNKLQQEMKKDLEKIYQLGVIDERDIILNLECLKKVKHEEDCLYYISNKYLCDCGADDINERLGQIKEEIKNLE